MLSVLLIGISLSMDAFAVAVTNGLTLRPFRTGHAVWMGLYFGVFQCLMPLAGHVLGGTVSGYAAAFGPYISFGLLTFIGVKMILEARKPEEEKGAAGHGGGTRLRADRVHHLRHRRRGGLSGKPDPRYPPRQGGDRGGLRAHRHRK